MKKLALDLEALVVESFHTAPLHATADGTVHAHESGDTECETEWASCYQSVCVTCGDSCHGSCMGPSCDVPTCSPDLEC
jgi:hypothetical protein